MSNPIAPTVSRSALQAGFAPLGWALALAGVVFLVSFEQGMLTAGAPVAHELFHDARHLLGFPCH